MAEKRVVGLRRLTELIVLRVDVEHPWESCALLKITGSLLGGLRLEEALSSGNPEEAGFCMGRRQHTE